MTDDIDTDDGEDTTQSASTRWAFTNDILVGVLIITSAAFVWAGVTLPPVWKVLLALGGIWLFGPKTVEALNTLRGK